MSSISGNENAEEEEEEEEKEKEEENDYPASDSDETSSEDADYYQPISTQDDHPLQEEEEEEEEEEEDHRIPIANGQHSQYPSEYYNNHTTTTTSPNGFTPFHMATGFSVLSLDNADVVAGGGCGEQAQDEDASQEEEASERAISAAFREDERRRSAPLTPERSSAIINAMHGVSFPGFRRPDWADPLLEGQWVDQLRRLRQPSTQNCYKRNL